VFYIILYNAGESPRATFGTTFGTTLGSATDYHLVDGVPGLYNINKLVLLTLSGVAFFISLLGDQHVLSAIAVLYQF
jgi:hypothetical protein